MMFKVKNIQRNILNANQLVSAFCMMGVGTYQGRIQKVEKTSSRFIELTIKLGGLYIPLAFRLTKAQHINPQSLKGCTIQIIVDHMPDENGNTLYYINKITINGGKNDENF